MKKFLIVFTILILLGFTNQKINSISLKNSENQITFIELYTSEGCSSCPPAETIFNELVQKSNPNLIAITFHVDYWDRLGWKDSFSDKKWTNRQGDYKEFFKNESIYTPQMIVNGTKEFVGSNEIKVTNSLQNKIKIENQIDLRSNLKNGNLIIDYLISGKTENKNLTLVLVQKQAEVFVKRGENSGRKLLHTNIARSIIDVDLKNNSGQLKLEIPIEIKDKDYFVVGIVQNKANKIISGILKL
jgi:hypothetical protein